MKFELKTEKENYPKSLLDFLKSLFLLSFIIIFCDIAIKLGFISRSHQIDYNCKRLNIEKSSTSFRKLSRLCNLKSKQRIWEFCREVLN